MAKMPGAIQRPLGKTMTQPRMLSFDVVCIHTMVGSLNGTESMFKQNAYTGTESHFGTGGDGEIRQWVDTAYSADANYQGSRYVISIENADHGPEFSSWNTRGDNVPAFTPAQIEANAQIIAWANKIHDIPIRLIANTRPGQRGVGYHAQGVPGNGLVSGGRSWSKSRGKVCPGRRRIAQIPQIIERAKQIAGGATSYPETPEGLFGMSITNAGKRTKDVTLPKGKWKTLPINDKNHVSLLNNVKKGNDLLAFMQLEIDKLPKGSELAARFYLAAFKSGAPTKRIHTFPRTEIIASAGKTFGQVLQLDQIGVAAPAGYSLRLRAEVCVHRAGVRVTEAMFKIGK